jgi:hypothetical protein
MRIPEFNDWLTGSNLSDAVRVDRFSLALYNEPNEG